MLLHIRQSFTVCISGRVLHVASHSEGEGVSAIFLEVGDLVYYDIIRYNAKCLMCDILFHMHRFDIKEILFVCSHHP